MTPFDKRFEKRLTDALSDRERQIDVDPDAWQTHLDLTRAHAGDRAGRAAAVHRWRAPALVAASVVGLGLIGGILAQAALSGGGPVSPAGTGSSAVSAPSGPGRTSGPGRGIPSSTGLDAPTSADRRTTRPSPPASSGAAGPRQSDGAPAVTVRSTRSLASTAAAPPQAGLTTQKPPATTSTSSVVHSARTTSTAQLPPGASAVSRGSAAVGRSLIDISDVVPCDRELPPLGKEVSDITVTGGPDGLLVNHAKQPVPVLAIGFAVLTGDGRVASVTGSDAVLSGITASPLPSGQSPLQDFVALRPLRLCGSPGTAAADSSVPSTSVVETYATSALPSGAYRATTVVLLGTDLDHAHAYRVGKTWRFSNR